MIKKNIINFLDILKNFGISKFFILFLLIVFATFLEVLSIAIIIPVIMVFQNPEFLKEYFQYFDNLKNLEHTEQIIITLIVLCLIFVCKFFFLIFVNYYQFKFSMNLQSEISKKLIQNYIQMPYKFFFKIDSSQLVRNIMAEPGMFVMGVLIPVIFLLTEFFVIFGITILLVYNIGIESLSIIIIFGLCGFLYIFFTKKIFKHLGEERSSIGEKIIRYSREALGGIREIKLNNTESIFFSFFREIFDKNAKILTKFFTYQILPRLGIEVIVVIFLSLSMLIFFIQKYEFIDIIAMLSLLGLSAVRLVPSTSKIMTSIQNIRFNQISIQNIQNGLKKKIKENQKNYKEINFKKTIELKKINFSYQKKTPILKNLNFLINKADRIGIIGKTGSGKSTLVDIISGLVNPSNGNFVVDKIKLRGKKITWKNKLGYVSQKTFLYNNTIQFNISFKNDNLENKKIYELLKQVELEPFVKGLRNKINSNIGENAIKISGGQKQRIGIARALYQEPELLILDEAFSALDPKTEEKIIKNISINYPKMTIINIAHKGPSLNYCNKIFNLDNKKTIIKNNIKKNDQ